MAVYSRYGRYQIVEERHAQTVGRKLVHVGKGDLADEYLPIGYSGNDDAGCCG
jgi:hypothetical protein